MALQQVDILFRLIIAHILADFIFQTDGIAKGKKNGFGSWHFYIHILIVGLITYVVLAKWTSFWPPASLMVLHGFIDWLKIQIKKNNIWTFLGDQALHFLTLVLIWILLTKNTFPGLGNQVINTLTDNKTLILITGYLIITTPVGVLIGLMTRKWSDELKSDGNESLTNAGKWIGIIERILVLTFILINQAAAIGFLLAAKSVFRFGDLKEGKDQKKTEYILIGTFLSFMVSIMVGVLIHYFLKNIKS